MGGSAGCVLRRWRRHLHVGALALLLSLLAPLPASAMHGPEHGMPLDLIRPLQLGETAWGILSVPRPASVPDWPPVILLLGDGDSALDGRNELYAQRRLSLGFALLDADFDALLADEGTPAHPTPEPIGRRLGLALGALDGSVSVDLRRLAAIGIGVGARAGLEGWAEHGGLLRAAVLLYPVCDADLLEACGVRAREPGAAGWPRFGPSLEQYPLTLNRAAMRKRMKLLAQIWLEHDPCLRIRL